MESTPLTLIVSLGSIVTWLVSKLRKLHQRKSFEEAATTLGLDLLADTDAESEQAKPEGLEFYAETFFRRAFPAVAERRARGTYRGLRVAIDVVARPRRFDREAETAFKVYYKEPVPFDLLIERLGGRGQIAIALGGQDVEVGDSLFDESLRVRSDSPEMARVLFQSPERRRAALDAFRAFPSLRATRTALCVIDEGIPHTRDRITAVLDRLVSLASAMGAKET
jgi:hypothetical protein